MSDYAHVGLWDDFDFSPVLRKSLTVPSGTGTIIITLLAILVTFAANRSWKIWRFLLHALLEAATQHFPGQSRAAIRQQQTILRNSETTGGAFLSFLEVAKGKHAATRSRPLAIALVVFTLLHWGLFLSLGILTTQVNIGNTVRSIATDDCGVWLPSTLTNGTATVDLNIMTSAELTINTTIAAENYVRNCYVSTSATISDCSVFARRLFPHTTQLVPCPLRDSTFCSEASSNALAVDSGNISWSDLGVNWQHAKEIYIRRRSIFTPINAASFLYDEAASRRYVDSNYRSEPPMKEPEQLQIFSFLRDEEGHNLTQVYRRNDGGGEYDVLTASVLNGSFLLETLQPQQLAPEVTLIVVRGRGVTFPVPSNDPLFYAQVESKVHMTNGNRNRTIVTYSMGRPLNVVIAQDMVEICSKLTDYCSGWIGPSDLSNAMTTTYVPKLMGPNYKKDYMTTVYALDIIAMPLMLSTTHYSVLYRGASALQATRKLQNARQYMISKDQWTIEAQNWFRISLAALQMAPHRMVSTPELDRSRVEKLGFFGGTWACSSVKFRSSKHVTLSFFGILAIVVVCVVLTIVSYLDEILDMLAMKRTTLILQPWNRDSYLQLLEDSEMLQTQSKIYTCLSVDSMATAQDSEKLMSTTPCEFYR